MTFFLKLIWNNNIKKKFKKMNNINNRIFDFQNKIIQIINTYKDKTQN